MVLTVLVSFKNIHIWPKNGTHAHIWAYFFGHNWAISWPIGLKIFVSSGDIKIIYWLWEEMQVTMLIFHFWYFGPLLAGKLAWPSRAPIIVLGLQTQLLRLANRYLENMFSNISGYPVKFPTLWSYPVKLLSLSYHVNHWLLYMYNV